MVFFHDPSATKEFPTFLREILRSAGFAQEELSDVYAHGLKATLLSYMAKWGAPERIRRLLGYHAKTKDRSMLEYSRDAVSEALRMLGHMLDEITDGSFNPDSTRSGYRAADAGARAKVRALRMPANTGGDPSASPAGMLEDAAVDASSVSAPDLVSSQIAGTAPDINVARLSPAKAVFDSGSSSDPDGFGAELSDSTDVEPTPSVGEDLEDVQSDDGAAIGELATQLLSDDDSDGEYSSDMPPIPPGGIFRHVKWGTYHVGRPDDSLALGCHRSIAFRGKARYEECAGWPIGPPARAPTAKH
jgi:hypothetical protein